MLATTFENSVIFKTRHWLVGCTAAVLLAVMAPGPAIASADQQGVQKSPSAMQKATPRARKKSHAAKMSVSEAQPAPAIPEQTPPKPPDWPANAKPAEASVVWNSKGLHIKAANSSLQQILNDVATATGTKVSGMGADQRVFGTYGPGPARDVLSQLLDGSGYNVLMIGDQGQGAPRQIVLSREATGPAPPVANNPGSMNDDNSADVEEPQPPPLVQPQNVPNGSGPAPQPRTPQQILQEMQRRQLLIEQMQQQTNQQNR
jgi:hypothetical protein